MTGNAMDVLASYLQRIGQLRPQELGSTEQPVTAQDTEMLREALQHQQRSSDRLVVVIVVMICVMFILDIYLVLHNLYSTPTITVISGTTLASILVLVRFLRRLWLDKSLMDMTLLASQRLDPAELAKLIASLYFGARRRETQ